MSRNRVVTAGIMLLALSVAAFAALNLVVGQRYTLEGTMSKCPHHADTYFIETCAGSGGGSHTAMAGSDGHQHDEKLLLKPASASVNLKTLFTSLKPGQKIQATGIYLGLVGSATSRDEKHHTLRTERAVAKPITKQEANFATLHDLRRQ